MKFMRRVIHILGKMLFQLFFLSFYFLFRLFFIHNNVYYRQQRDAWHGKKEQRKKDGDVREAYYEQTNKQTCMLACVCYTELIYKNKLTRCNANFFRFVFILEISFIFKHFTFFSRVYFYFTLF